MKKTVVTATFLGLFSAWSHAQTKPDTLGVSDPSRNDDGSIEDLNLIGAETAMPPFVESPIDINSSFRHTLLSKGIALRGLPLVQYAQKRTAGSAKFNSKEKS